MISRNLRHFRVFLSVAKHRSPTVAAVHCVVSQPAVTQSLAKLEREAGGALFDRTQQGFFLTRRGEMLEARLRRAMHRLDQALRDLAPRLVRTATAPQLVALIAMSEHQNYTLAARSLGLAQPTVHRSISQIEQESDKPLFERASFGMVATQACKKLAHAARLAFSEFEQIEAELAELDGKDVGRIVVGSLPLSRSAVLPQALVHFRERRPKRQVTIIDGPYDDLLNGLRRGEIDFVFGALRYPAPIKDVEQEHLFFDSLAILARPGHPLANDTLVTQEKLHDQGWVVPREGTPARKQFDAEFAGAAPTSIFECGSILLMREILRRTDLLGCISSQQAEIEIDNGLLVALETGIEWQNRPIGFTFRSDWVPTESQSLLLELVRESSHSSVQV